MAKTKEKEFKLAFFKGVNDAWGASAYFVNRRTQKKHCVTIYAMPGEKSRIAKGYITERFDERVPEFLAENPGYERVERDEFENFKHQF